jgi:glycosyltransferase involved in cell wall biosynthesis
MTRPLRIVHVINNLATGGAESMLARLAIALGNEFEQSVICILDRGPLATRLEEAGVPVSALGVSPRAPNPLAVLSLAKRIRTARPDIVQTWLYQSDLLGGIAARIAGTRGVVWNLRGADLSPIESHPLTRLIVKSCSRLSHFLPTRIVCCAESVMTEHERLGYDRSRMIVIRNGVDVSRFRPDPDARIDVRLELQLGPDTPLVGLIARMHPQKDHDTFFSAAAELRRTRRDVNFVLAGKGMTRDDPQVSAMLRRHSLGAGMHLLGQRDDIPRLTAALDVATSSSAWGEGFQNAIAEAMACGVPCAATDAGDARLIIDDTGVVVARRDPPALATAWAQLLSLRADEMASLADRARRRIEGNFDLSQCSHSYARLYREVAGVA